MKNPLHFLTERPKVEDYKIQKYTFIYISAGTSKV